LRKGEQAMAIESIEVRGWTLARLDGEPDVRIHDLELARRSGLAQPRNIRQVIKRLEKRGRLPGILMRTVAMRIEIGPKSARTGERVQEVQEYWLTRTEALRVIDALDTPPAEAMRDEMIRVFEMALDGKLPGQAISAEMIRAAVREEMAAAIEPVTRRLDVIEHRTEVIEHRPVASIGPVEQRALQDARERLASLRVLGKLSPTLRSAHRWVMNLIETEAERHGKGWKLTMIRVDRFHDVMVALNNAIQEAQKAADRERNPTLPFGPKAA
jgi:hypothetical protein